MGDETEKAMLVMDAGSCVTKAGFAGDDQPAVIIPTIIGRPKYPPAMPCLNYPSFYLGHEAQRRRGILCLQHPVSRGSVVNKNDHQEVLKHVFEDCLHVDPSQQPILIAEHTLNPAINKEVLGEMLFEHFKVPSLYFVQKPVLSLYAAGMVTGCILYSGEGVTASVVVWEGYSVKPASARINFGGMDLTHHLSRLVAGRGEFLTNSAEMEIVRDMKEKLCFVAQDAKKDEEENEYKIYTLPDGRTVDLGSERFQCPEALFSPSTVGKEEKGLPALVHEAVTKTDRELHKALFGSVVLAGGNTLFPGLATRLSTELTHFDNVNSKVRVVAPAERKHTVWLGGSILGSLSSFKKLLVSKEEYDEIGPKVLHERCVF